MRPSRTPRPDADHPPGAAGAIYPPREDSWLLVPFARVTRGSSLLEVGAGAGIAALEAARCGARVVATDLNPFALARLRDAARADALELEVVRTDLANGLGRFDRILANPPYLPTRPEERDPDRWHNLALDGGPDGTRVTARLVASVADHLAPRGAAFLLVSSVQSAEGLGSVLERWGRFGGRHEVVARQTLEGERLEV
ncbi:MAG: HemK2/MTQ2 family protein methyltransferase, partial [Thermoplasmata archaeon]